MSYKLNKAVLNYNPKYKMNIHESLLIWLNKFINVEDTNFLSRKIPVIYILPTKGECSFIPKSTTWKQGRRSFTMENSDKQYFSKVITSTSTVINHANRCILVWDENGNSIQVNTSVTLLLNTRNASLYNGEKNIRTIPTEGNLRIYLTPKDCLS